MPKQTDDQQRLLDNAAFVAKRIQIEDIYVIRIAASRNFDGEPPPVIEIGFVVNSARNETSNRIRVNVAFSFRAFHESAERAPIPPLAIEVEFALTYVLTSDDEIDSEKVEAFGQMNGVYNAWPYIRELVQSTLTRMSLPSLTLPVLTSGLLTQIYRNRQQDKAFSAEGSDCENPE